MIFLVHELGEKWSHVLYFTGALGKGVPFLFQIVWNMPSKVEGTVVAFWGVKTMFLMHGTSIREGKPIAPLLRGNNSEDKTTEKTCPISSLSTLYSDLASVNPFWISSA